MLDLLDGIGHGQRGGRCAGQHAEGDEVHQAKRGVLIGLRLGKALAYALSHRGGQAILQGDDLLLLLLNALFQFLAVGLQFAKRRRMEEDGD